MTVPARASRNAARGRVARGIEFGREPSGRFARDEVHAMDTVPMR
jgi:hypothetical protein